MLWKFSCCCNLMCQSRFDTNVKTSQFACGSIAQQTKETFMKNTSVLQLIEPVLHIFPCTSNNYIIRPFYCSKSFASIPCISVPTQLHCVPQTFHFQEANLKFLEDIYFLIKLITYIIFPTAYTILYIKYISD